MDELALFDVVERSAVLSECDEGAADREHDRESCVICDVYRYELRRIWGPGPILVWIMLNPSTADAAQDDATIRKCIRFAKKWGYGGIIVLNLYALRATKPEALWSHPDPIGPRNDAYLLSVPTDLMVVCAWGTDGRRGAEVLDRLVACGVQPHYLSLTAGGEPGHPLYLKETLKPKPLVVAGGATIDGGSR
jgi:hypothetical protein